MTEPNSIANLRHSLIDPHSLWSLWVPVLLLGFILAAAVYFAQFSSSK